MSADEILARLEGRAWSAGVLGLGYVGLPLLVTLADAGVEVTGFDLEAERIDGLRAGVSPIDDVPSASLEAVRSRTAFTTDSADLRDRDVLFICVPTPLAPGKQPDLSYLENAVALVASVLRPGHTVIVESTTSPGTTQDLVGPRLEETGLRLDEDFLLAHSPERVDPGNGAFHTRNIARIVGGATPAGTRAAVAIYGRFVDKVHPVADARTAEMTKLFENTFRWVNIALANEMAGVARALGVNIWEIIDAAATKPFGFMPFYPGPGVGGHCIPLDPFYLEWTARMSGAGTRFIELADRINSQMPVLVVGRVQELLNERSRSLRGANILVLGVAYKSNVKDHRESPALECIEHLLRAGAHVAYADPHVPEIHHRDALMSSVELTADRVASYDCVVLLTDHDAFDLDLVAQNAQAILDTRNGFGRRGLAADTISTL